MMHATHLTGLEGTNPLGFLAALGVQVAFASEAEQPRLWWSDDITPHAVVGAEFTIDRIADQSMVVFDYWKNSPAMNPRRADESVMPKGDELKLESKDIRTYLDQSRQHDSAGDLITALVAEESLDNSKKAKPTDLYFTAGRQKFLCIARQILDGVSKEESLTGLTGPWSYKSPLKTLGWDVSDDRMYALMANNPSSESSPDQKLTNPGPEALAVLGLSLHPVFTGKERTLTQGCSGLWTKAHYSWPLWRKPASTHAVKSILAHAYDHPTATNRHRWLRSWGVFKVLRSPIRRSGHYGTFSPPEVAWQA